MPLPRRAHSSWIQCPAFDMVPSIMSSLIPGTFYPSPAPDIFAAFEMPVDDVKAVMLGLSPYPSPFYIERGYSKRNACGYAFMIEDADRKFEDWPPSLKILAQNCTKEPATYFDPSGSLWRAQGILLLNAALTCLHKSPESHLKLWHHFMVELIQWLDEKKDPMIFYFLGDEAKKFARYVFDLKHHKLVSMHPAKAARTGEEFDGKMPQLKSLYESLYGKTLDLTLPF